MGDKVTSVRLKEDVKKHITILNEECGLSVKSIFNNAIEDYFINYHLKDRIIKKESDLTTNRAMIENLRVINLKLEGEILYLKRKEEQIVKKKVILRQNWNSVIPNLKKKWREDKKEEVEEMVKTWSSLLNLPFDVVLLDITE